MCEALIYISESDDNEGKSLLNLYYLSSKECLQC